MLKYNKLTTEYLAPTNGKNSGSVPVLVENTIEESKEILQDISIFGDNLTETEIKMIKSWEKDFRKKMEGILIFQETTITILVNGKELVFDKKPLSTNMIRWDDAKNLANSNNKRIPTVHEFNNIFDLFEYDYKKAINILSLSPYNMWTNTECDDGRVWFVNFNSKTIDIQEKTCPNLHAVFINN